jgi:hypothetical protein
MESWPSQLRQLVLLVIADPAPAVVYWGDTQVGPSTRDRPDEDLV